MNYRIDRNGAADREGEILDYQKHSAVLSQTNVGRLYNFQNSIQFNATLKQNKENSSQVEASNRVEMTILETRISPRLVA